MQCPSVPGMVLRPRTAQIMCKGPEDSQGLPGYHWPQGPHSRPACFTQGNQISGTSEENLPQMSRALRLKRENSRMVASSGPLTLLCNLPLLKLGRPLSDCYKVAGVADPVTCCLQTPLMVHILSRKVEPSLPAPTAPTRRGIRGVRAG